MTEIQEIPDLDTAIEPEHDSWSSQPVGLILLLEESPEYKLMLDGEHFLLIE